MLRYLMSELSTTHINPNMDSEEDDLSTAVATFAQFEAQVQHTSHFSAQFASGARDLLHHSTPSSDDDPGPGRGYSVDGTKARYVRRDPSRLYNFVCEEDADFSLATKLTHLSCEEFDALHALVLAELQKPFNVRGRHDDNGMRIPRRRK